MLEDIPESISGEVPRDVREDVPKPAEQVSLEEPIPARGARSAWALLVVLAGWMVPGLGHLLQRRIGRALIGFLGVGAMALLGLWMRGNVFPPHADDAFGVLGFVADASSGLFYLVAHSIEKAGPDVSRAAGDYGTRLVATAGVINLLFVLDALEISRGHKN